jgi:hypothetical protein
MDATEAMNRALDTAGLTRARLAERAEVESAALTELVAWRRAQQSTLHESDEWWAAQVRLRDAADRLTGDDTAAKFRHDSDMAVDARVTDFEPVGEVGADSLTHIVEQAGADVWPDPAPVKRADWRERLAELRARRVTP